MDKRIPTIGASVDFENDHGTQSGSVVGIKRDITNGQLCAMVAIDASIKTAAVPVPLTHLQEKDLRHVV